MCVCLTSLFIYKTCSTCITFATVRHQCTLY